MATQTSTTRKYLIGSSILVLLGIGGYLLWKRNKTKKDKAECEKNKGVWDEATKTCTIVQKEVIVQAPVISSNQSTQTQYPSTGLSQADGDAFRTWVNEKYPDYAKKEDLSKTGAPDNSFIRKAFAQYGTEWKNSKSGKATILPTNADSFTKLASSLVTPIFLLTDGRRMTALKFKIKDATIFDTIFGGTWKIEFYEQALADSSKQSYRIIDGYGNEFQNGFWSNNGKTLRVINGKNKGSSSTTDKIEKTIGNVVNKEVVLA